MSTRVNGRSFTGHSKYAEFLQVSSLLFFRDFVYYFESIVSNGIDESGFNCLDFSLLLIV